MSSKIKEHYFYILEIEENGWIILNNDDRLSR